MTDSLVQGLTSALTGKVSGELIIFIISMIPILRAIPICVLGNLLPIPIILIMIEAVLDWMERIPGLCKIALWLRRKADKNKGSIEKYGFLGLVLFVGIPLPGTGAWTGALVASVFGMSKKKAIISICAGVLTAGLIMTFGSQLVKFIVGLF